MFGESKLRFDKAYSLTVCENQDNYHVKIKELILNSVK